MNEFNWQTAFAVFATYVVVDVLYAWYIICVSDRRAIAAATLSAFIYSLLAFGVVSYSKNVLYLVPLASGAFFGTLLTVWMQRRPRGIRRPADHR